MWWRTYVCAKTSMKVNLHYLCAVSIKTIIRTVYSGSVHVAHWDRPHSRSRDMAAALLCGLKLFCRFFLLFDRHAIIFSSSVYKTTAASVKTHTHKPRKRDNLVAIFHSGSLQVRVCHWAQYRDTTCVCVRGSDCVFHV